MALLKPAAIGDGSVSPSHPAPLANERESKGPRCRLRMGFHFDFRDRRVHVHKHLLGSFIEDSADQDIGQAAYVLRMLFHKPPNAELLRVERVHKFANPLCSFIKGLGPRTQLRPTQIIILDPLHHGITGTHAHFECEVDTRRINRVDEPISIAHQYPTVTGRFG